MRIGILGTGTMAEALGTSWARAGHDLVIGGRSPAKAQSLAERLGSAAPTDAGPRGGGTVRAGTLRDAATGQDAVLLAVRWEGVEEVLRSAGAADGTLSGTPLIDPTNAVEHGVGVLLTEHGSSAAQRIASWAPSAHVVKAFHLFPAQQWVTPDGVGAVVPVCGDDAGALRVTGELVRDAGGVPAVLGPLARARQLEEAAGFVIGLAFGGFDPNAAVPSTASAGTAETASDDSDTGDASGDTAGHAGDGATGTTTGTTGTATPTMGDTSARGRTGAAA